MKRFLKISVVKIVFVLLFFIIIGYNFIIYGFIKSTDLIDTHENRKKTDFPTKDTSDYKTYFNRIETYYSDRFILKYFYINTINYYRYKLFKFSNANKKVIYGKDGWLFLNSCTYNDVKGIDEYYGLITWEPNRVKHFVDNLETIKSFCEKNNIVFIPVLCPSKHSVYDDELPLGSVKYQNNRYDDIIAQSNHSLIDYRELLKAEKPLLPYPLYYKTDTHWNPLGAYFADIEVSKALHKYFPDFPVLGLKDITIHQNISKDGRDLANMAVLDKDFEEYNVEINLNTKILKKVNKALIIHDSYFDIMKPIEQQFFNEIQERNIMKKQLTTKEILDYHPDVFIYEVVERYLDEMNYELEKDFYK
jgi:hypothetical protein